MLYGCTLLRLRHSAASAGDLEGDNPCQSITLHSQSHQAAPAWPISAVVESKGLKVKGSI